MYSLNTNIDALNARNATRVSSNSLSQSLKRLSTGLRINSSVDDSAGLIEANRLRSDSGALKESIKNANNTIAMFQIIDKAIDQQINLLDTMRAKAIQASTDGQSKITREALQTEIEGLLKELDNIARETSFGNQKLLDGTFFNKQVHIGKDSSNTLDFSFNATSSDKMGFSSYKTTDGGVRLIDNLNLTFKNTGTSNEDVSLAPFTLSTSPGKTIVDLANFVNKYTEDTGVRAIYKEGNTLPVYKRNSLTRDLLNEAKQKEKELNTNTTNQTTSSYIEKDFPIANKVQVSDISFYSLPKPNTDITLKAPKEDLDYNIDFRASTKPTVIAPAGKTFHENVSNANYFNGNTLTLQLAGDEFTSENPADKITVENLPDYLQANFARSLDKKSMEVTLSAKPDTSVPSSFPTGDHKVNNINFKFTDPKLFNSKIVPDDIGGFSLSYSNDPKIHFNTVGNFKETSANDGRYAGKVTLELQGGTLTNDFLALDAPNRYNSIRYDTLAYDPASNQKVDVIGNNKIVFDITGRHANHGENDDQVFNLSILNGVMFEGGAQPVSFNPAPASASTYIDFADRPKVTARKSFTEHSNNDGTISTSIVLRVDGDKFNDDISDANLKDNITISYGGDIAGLEVHYRKNNTNEITVTYTKNASDANDDNTINITKIEFKPELFERSIASADAGSVEIKFLKDPDITIGTNTVSFTEKGDAPGEIDGSLVLNVTDGVASFNKTNIKDYIDINLPDGLTPSYTVTDSQSLVIAIDGVATNHNFRVEDIDIGFKREALNPNVFSSKITSHIDFFDSAYIIPDGPFKEDGDTNDGTISNEVNLLLKNNEKIVGKTTDDVLVLGTDYVINDLPDGLTANLVVVDDENIKIDLKATKATTHVNNKNFSVTLKGSMLKSGIDTKPADIRVEFKKASRIIEVGGLRESAANNGKISSKATFELTDGVFDGNPVLVTAPLDKDDNPLGAVWSTVPGSPNTIILELTGEAKYHASFNQGEVIINFKGAIKGGATDTVGLENYVTKITFVDELPEFKKLYGNFLENQKNRGQVKGEVALELPSGIDFNVGGYNIDAPDEINTATGISLSRFLRRNIKASSLPFILEPSYKLDPLNPRRLLVSFIQDAEEEKVALSHNSSDSTSFRLGFKPSLFVADKNVNDISLDITFYDEPEVIAFGSFKESPRNDGSTDDFVELSVLGGKFARVNPNNYIKVTGIPSSLTPKFVTDKSSIRFYLEGKSKNHDEFDDLNNIKLEFITNTQGVSRLFENGIQPANLRGIQLDFKNKPIPQIEENFTESLSNDGSIDKPITITLKEGTFKTKLNPAEYIKMTKVPAGLQAKYKILDDTRLEVTLQGNAFNHSLSENVTDAELEIDADLFISGIKPDKIKNIEISFLGAPEVTYEGEFVENEENNGGVDGVVTLSVDKDTFQEGISLDNSIIIGNLPAGLSPVYKLKNETTIEFTLTGKALNHTNYNDLDNLSVSFTSNLFTQKVLPTNQIEDIKIDFKDTPKIFYNDYFKESSKNDGSIRNIITLDLFGDNLTSINPNADGIIKVRNLPSGLTPLFVRTKANQLTMQLLGESNNHSKLDAIQDISIEFSNQLFRNGVAPSSLENILIDYRDRPELSTTDAFIESSFNDGSFDDAVTFSLSGDTFDIANNPNNTIFVKNLPAGLVPKFTILNDNQIELRLEGKAIKHDLSTIKPELVFQDPTLFFSGIAPEDFIIENFNFVEAPVVSLSGEFTESFLNDGTISNTVFLTVEHAVFNQINSDKLNEYISISNLPSGLEPVFVKIEDKIQITLTGTAVKHTNLYDVDDLRLEFSQELFDTGVSANIINNGIVNFREPPKVSTRSFIESDKNDGTIANIVTLELADDDKFTRVDLNANIKVISPPDGLSPFFAPIPGDDNHITLRLDGSANNHADIHDLDDITLEFDPSIFESNQNADPITNMVVDFKDPPPPVIESKVKVFEEAEANDGSIEKAIDFSVQYDELSDVYNFKYSSTIKNIKNIIGDGDNLILNGVNIADIDTNSPDFYPELIAKINNNRNGTGGLFASLDGTDIKLFKDFQNTISVEGSGSRVTIQNDDEEDESIKREFATADMIGHLIEATGVPRGLTLEYKQLSKVLFSVTLKGNADKHLNKHDTDKTDIESLKFKFKAGLFSRNVQGKDLNDVSINFNDPTIEFSNSFKESTLDDGSIGNKVTVTLFGDTFNDETRLDQFITANNVPKGLTPAYVRLSDTEIEMSLIGNAPKHLDEHDINNITLSFSKEIFSQGLAIYPDTKLSINFNDPPDPVYVPGGPGAYGGYLTFISDRSSDLVIDTGDADFGLNESKFSTTLNLRDAITKDLNRKDLFGIGYTDDIDYAIHEGSMIKGVNHKQSASVVMDAVDSAIEYLKKMRAKVASYQIQVEKRVEFLNVQRANVISAESTIREIDFAEETSNFQKRNLLTQAGNYAISQANASKKMILTLLQQ